MSTENPKPAESSTPPENAKPPESKLPEGDIDSLLSGIMEIMDKNPELKSLAGNLASTDLSPLLGLLGSMEKQTLPVPSAPQTGADRAEALLHALKPFLNPTRASSVERAIHMLSTAKTVRTAIHAFGAMSSGNISV